MRWKSRLVAFILCFAIGFVVASIVAALLSFFGRTHNGTLSPCATADYFNSPEEVLAALKNPEVNVRRTIFNQLFLRPDLATVYYDYERDANYPERADRARLLYVQLDRSPELEAVLTFVRFEHPVALVFKKKSCGWYLVTALSSWLRFEDYPYENWLSLREALESGVQQLLIRDSYGDAASYSRKARLFRLTGDSLTQIAELEEEVIEPVVGYDGSDWSDLKRRRVTQYRFGHHRKGDSANIQSEVTDEIIKLNGAVPRYSYWLETDGSWHTRKSNWSRRPATPVKLVKESRNFMSWNQQEGRFNKP